jgi:hypothetical protein
MFKIQIPDAEKLFYALLVLIILSGSCGKKKIEAGSPEEVLFLIREKGQTESVFDYYTDDTIQLLKKYIKITGMKKESAVNILSFIPAKSEYNIQDRKIDDRNCSMKLVFTRHTSENAVGLAIAINMVKEGKSWKIDRGKDFKQLIESYEKKGAEDYLKKIK